MERESIESLMVWKLLTVLVESIMNLGNAGLEVEMGEHIMPQALVHYTK